MNTHTGQKREHLADGENPSVFSRILEFFDRIIETWYSSLRIRVALSIVVGGLLVAGIIGITVVSTIRNSVFDQAVSAYVEHFAGEEKVVQEKFSAAVSPTAGQTQQVANEFVSSMYDPNRGLLGAALIRANGQNTIGKIVEPTTASATAIRSLVSEKLRSAVSRSDRLAWQSVAAKMPDGSVVPGIVVGTSVQIPNSGTYHLFALYSLANQNKLLQTTVRALLIGLIVFAFGIALLTYLILRMVLRPVREASHNARRLAKGEFDVRMDVSGTDELARLGTSFNRMAASLEDQFTKLERMSAIQTNFVSAVSHELRSPVTTIRMAGQLLYDKRDELPGALKRSAELQHAQVKNLDSMLSDLLEISRYDAGAMALVTERVQVAQIVENVLVSLRPLALDNGVVPTLEVSGDTTAEVEPRRVERVIRNLAVNALEHAEGKPVRIRVVANDSAVAVEVADHGIGLSADQAAHVFDRFWRADTSRVRKTGGTGLGLTIAREDANIHGGTLEAGGEPGVGAVFLFTVPKMAGAVFTPPLELKVPQPYSPEGDGALPGAENAAQTDGFGENGTQAAAGNGSDDEGD